MQCCALLRVQFETTVLKCRFSQNATRDHVRLTVSHSQKCIVEYNKHCFNFSGFQSHKVRLLTNCMAALYEPNASTLHTGRN